MGIKTKISWCDSSANLQMGCNGCELWTTKNRVCYSGIITEKYAGRKGWPDSFNKPKIFPERIDKIIKWSPLAGKPRPHKPWLNGLPRLVFLNDMGDTFTESLSIDWLKPFMEKLENSEHNYLILTKRPKRMYQFFDLHGYVPDNFWLGVSITNQEQADKRIPELLKIPAKVRFLSCEPLLGYVDLVKWITVANGGLHWVIMGGESGSNRRAMDQHWWENLLWQCQKYNIPFFCKQDSTQKPGQQGRIPDWLWDIKQFPNERIEK